MRALPKWAPIVQPGPLRRRRPGAMALMPVITMLACAGLVACASPPAPPAPRTTVILLPDDDGGVGTVLVATEAGTQRLDQAFTAATVVSAAGAPSAAHALGRDKVQASHADLLHAQPPAPESFILHFLLDKTVLTDASKAQLPALLAALRARQPSEVLVFGHADASGTDERNRVLSDERARFVAEWLRRQDPSLDKIQVHAFGAALPLLPSDARRPEPRNRRAEVMFF